MSIISISYSQIPGVFLTKEYSKEQAVYGAKYFVLNEVIGVSDSTTKFKIEALASATSGELTTLIYNCEQNDKKGLVFGFYGDYWNKAGVTFKAYGFKNLNKEHAVELLSKLESIIIEHRVHSKITSDFNNVFCVYISLKIFTIAMAMLPNFRLI